MISICGWKGRVGVHQRRCGVFARWSARRMAAGLAAVAMVMTPSPDVHADCPLGARFSDGTCAGGGPAESSSSTSTTCVPGQQTWCACPGGTSGVQACSDDGQFGACSCTHAEPKRIPDWPNLTLGARLSYEAWLIGTVAGQPIGSVFSGGPSTQADIGLITGRGTAIYAGFDYVFYGAGSSNPYVAQRIPSVSARAEYFMLGVRHEGCTEPSDVVHYWFAIDLGYEILHSDASDNVGNSASVDLGNFAARTGLGVCIRPTSGLVITPALMTNLLLSAGGQSSSVTVGGVTRDTSGDISNKSLIWGLIPGLGVQGEFDF